MRFARSAVRIAAGMDTGPGLSTDGGWWSVRHQWTES